MAEGSLVIGSQQELLYTPIPLYFGLFGTDLDLLWLEGTADIEGEQGRSRED
jgi:hypothetical protein